jgi:DNA-binding beta-propeller fold protein YncE
VFARAVALGAAGRDADAAAAVRVLLRWDPRYARRALQDSALARVGPLLHDADIAALAERADRPIARGHVWAVLKERDLVLEGTAWDSRSGRLLVGSLNKNKIVAVAPDGALRDLVARGAHGLGSVAGIHVDSARGILWVASNARFDDPSDTATAALFAFDAATGAFRRRIDLPPGESFPNDLTTGPDGTVYLTDSRRPAVFVLRPNATAFETFAPIGQAIAPNGITISADGRHLFVADFDHVQVVALADGQTWRLATPDSINMSGIDGLAFADGALIAHHPLGFWRIARYDMDRELRRVLGVEFIERNTPDSRTSTTGEVVGDSYYYIGNSQIDRMNQRTLDSATMAPIRLYRAPLRQPAAGRLAVALSSADSVAVFDAHSLERLATLRVGTNPHEITPAAEGTAMFVANARDSSISVLELSPAPRVRATWRMPDGISVHDLSVADDGVVWAAAGEPPVLLALDAASGTVRRRYTMRRPGSWMLDAHGPDGAIIVANLEGGAVTLVEPASGGETILEASEGEIDAVATPDGSEIWSVNSRTGVLTVFDARSGRAQLRRQSGPQASRVVFTPDGRTALIVHGGDSSVVAYDVRSRQRVASVTIAAGPKVIAISADGRRAYVTHPHGALTMIDVPSMSVLRSIPLSGTPDGVAVGEPPAEWDGA